MPRYLRNTSNDVQNIYWGKTQKLDVDQPIITMHAWNFARIYLIDFSSWVLDYYFYPQGSYKNGSEPMVKPGCYPEYFQVAINFLRSRYVGCVHWNSKNFRYSFPKSHSK